jgi:hypothetical protein
MKPKPIIRKYKGYIIHFKRIYDLWQWRKDNTEFVFMPITYPYSAKTLEEAKSKIDKEIAKEKLA